MSYEFNQKDSAWSFPNPYRFENIFLFVASVIMLAGGVLVTLAARDYMTANEMKVGAATMALAAILFGGAAKMGIQCLGQMRFFFGRQFPIGLADQLPVSTSGDSPAAVHVREVMRQRAVEFEEPTGPLNGVLYSLIKPLITSPPTIQIAASQHFHSLCAMTAILVSLFANYMVIRGLPHEGIVSWAYLPLTGLSLLTPFRGAKAEVMPSSNSMLGKVVGFATLAIIGPVLIQHTVPAWHIPPMWGAPALLLIGSMTASGLFLISLFKQIDDVKVTDVSCVQTTIAMNCPPSQLWTEISRDFQDNWVRGIPNRAYTNMPPDVSASERGSFTGNVLEETQPMPTDISVFNSLGEAWKEGYARYLILLSLWGIILSAAGVWIGVHFADKFVDMERMEISRVILVVMALEISTMLSFKIAHLLWSRMYFRSRLMWIEVAGTYQTSTMSLGNQFTGNAQSSSTLTRIEDATLRVWSTDIVTVAFGKTGSRYIMAMAPAESFVKATADKLIRFASEQSSIATLTSSRDIAKITSMRSLGKAMEGDPTALLKMTVPKESELDILSAPDEKQSRTGVVKFFDDAKKFGFIVANDGVERFFNMNQTAGHVFSKGDLVSFDPANASRGPQANRVRKG